MKRNNVLAYMCVGIIAVALIPVDVFAVNASAEYGGDVIASEAGKLKALLFGPVMYYVSILSCVWSMILAFFTQAIKQIVFFIGLGLTSGLMPQFIEKVFSLMLP